ncbi:cytochrome b/b6 domain-containing protein, partial [Rhodococcus sp. IEGM 1404]|nr:cytochrome b/b6 domain-containing protein [Microbacterium sp. IEGM 1404]
VGIPAGLGWQLFLNSLFLLLVIRSGVQFRRQKRPDAFWSPRGTTRRRISLALWFHQAIYVLWIANGVIY